MAGQRWRDMSPARRRVLMVVGAIQIGLAVTSWVDLARRPREAVNGRKALWALAICVNTIGPLAYLRFGRVKSAS